MNFFKKLTVASLIMGTTFSLSFPFFSNATNLEKELNKYETVLTQEVGNISTIDNKEDISKYSQAYQQYLQLTDEEKAKVNVIPRKYDVPFEEIYNIKEKQNEKSLFNNVGGEINQEEMVLPKKFDLRDIIDIKVENQENYGVCWSFAGLSCIETNLALKKGIDKDFSELHVDYMTSDLFYENYENYLIRALHSGGNFEVFMEYLVENPSPVLEEEVPYHASYEPDSYEYLMNLETQAYVEDVVRFPTMDYMTKKDLDKEEIKEFRDAVKKHIMTEGGISAAVSIHDYSFNTITNASNNNLIPWPDHAVTIIGWDDNYPKENFWEGCRPENDGAYIVLNSWGEDFGKNGYLYISYEDILIEEELDGVINASLTPIEGDIVEFKDENLYKAIKEKMADYILDCDDSALKIEFNPLTNNITKDILDLSNLGIKDITGLEYFENYYEINLSKNEIEDISPLKNMVLDALNLSDNNIQDLINIPEVVKLNLSNCNLTNVDSLITNDNKRAELLELHLSGNNLTDLSCLSSKETLEGNNSWQYLDLSKNKNLLLDTLSADIFYLVLQNCDIDNEQLELIKNIGEICVLDLANNNYSDITVLADMEYLDELSISYTQVKQLPKMDNITVLVAKGMPELQGFENITNLYYLNLENSNLENLDNITAENLGYLILNNNNLTDLSDLSRFTKLEGLYLNKNIDIDITTIPEMPLVYDLGLTENNIKDISTLDKSFPECAYLDLDNNQIEDISVLKNFDRLTWLDLHTNIIADASSLDGKEYKLDYVDMSNNQITEIALDKLWGTINVDNNCIIEPTVTNIDSMDSYYSIKNQRCVLPNIDLEINKQVKIDLPQVFSKLYYDRYKTDFKYTAEGCSLDLKNGKLIVEPTTLGEGTCKITIDKGGIYTGSTYTLNYNCVEKVEAIGLGIIQGGKNKYIEGEDFDDSGYAFILKYENGLYEEITEYEITNGTNLQKDQDHVLIQYNDYDLVIDIVVYSEDEVEKIKFNDVNLYNIMCEHLNIDGERNVISINLNELELIVVKESLGQVEKVSIYGDAIADYTGLSKFYNIKILDINDYNAKDTSELEKLSNLEELYINYTDVENFEGLSNIPTLKKLKIFCAKDIVIGELIEQLEVCNIEGYETILEAKTDGNKVYLSQYIKQIINSIEEPIISIYNGYELEELELQEDSSGNLYIEIDMEKVEEVLNNGDLIFYISVRDEHYNFWGMYGVEYTRMMYGYEITDEFVLNILPNTPVEDFKSIFTNDTNYTITLKESIEDENETTSEIIKTGMIVQIKDIRGEILLELKAVVKGDMNCDGVADAKDWISLKGYRTEVVEFSEEQIEAADLNDDGEINYTDSKLLLLHRAEVDGYDLNYKK